MGEGWGEGNFHRTKAHSTRLAGLAAGPGVGNRRLRLHRKTRARDPKPSRRHTSRTHTDRSTNSHRDPSRHTEAGSTSDRNRGPNPDRVGRRNIAP